MDDRVGRGEFERHGVMIGDDHVHAQRFCQSDLFGIADTTVAGDDELGAIIFEELYGTWVEAVAVGFAVGEINTKICAAKFFERRHDDGRSANAVGIVVAVYGNFFVVFKTVENERDCFFHVVEKEWIVDVFVVIGVQKFVHLLFCPEVAVPEEADNNIGQFSVAVKKIFRWFFGDDPFFHTSLLEERHQRENYHGEKANDNEQPKEIVCGFLFHSVNA